jgi:hypothetical protein
LGEWVIDQQRLVYRATDETWNVTELPQGSDYHYLLGVDLGDSDDTAFVLGCYSKHDRRLFVVNAFKEPEMHLGTVADIIKQTQAKYSCPIYVDGKAKQTIRTFVEHFRIPLVFPADQTAKSEHINIFNYELSVGNIKVLPNAKDVLEGEWSKLIWDHQKLLMGIRQEDKAFPNHASDACLYMWRMSRHYMANPLAKKERLTAEQRDEREAMEELKHRLKELEDAHRGDHDFSPNIDAASDYSYEDPTF